MTLATSGWGFLRKCLFSPAIVSSLSISTCRKWSPVRSRSGQGHSVKHQCCRCPPVSLANSIVLKLLIWRITMNRLRLCLLTTSLLVPLSAVAPAQQVTGSGKPNVIPLWTGTTNPSTTQGNSSITENPTTKAITIGGALQVNGNLSANQLSGPLGTLLYH